MFISLNKIKIKYSMHRYSILMHILGNWLIIIIIISIIILFLLTVHWRSGTASASVSDV